MSDTKIIRKVALALFVNKKMMQVRSIKEPKVFFTLGGKIEPGESDIDCLKREVKEEINCQLKEDSVRFLTEFTDVAHTQDYQLVNIKMYTGEIAGLPKPSSEIAEIGFFDSNSPKEHLSEIARRTIFPWLKERGFIN